MEVMKKTKKNEKTNLAKNLILARFNLGMSGERFAEYLEIPYGTLRDIEAGISGGRMSTKLKIAQKLNTTVDALEGPTPGEQAARKVAQDRSLKLERLIAVLPSLDETEISAILESIADMRPDLAAIARAE